jgi:hypothetical protein
MKITTILIFSILIIAGCSKKTGDPLPTTGSSIILEEEEVPNDVLTAENYSIEAMNILESHRKELKRILPVLVRQEVKIYQRSLVEMDKKCLLTYCLRETDSLKSLEKSKVRVSLFEKEVELNQKYFQLFNELSLLNERYSSISKDTLGDFYEAGPIVLSEEVVLKIDEFVKDEKVRQRIEKGENTLDYISTALSVVSIIPGGALAKELLIQITKAAKAYKSGKAVIGGVNFVGKVAYKVMNRKVATFVSKVCSNHKKRLAIATVSGRASLITNGSKELYTRGRQMTSEQTAEVFKDIGNKLDGRVIDFSDGILAVHIQTVRDMIKRNADLITLQH